MWSPDVGDKTPTKQNTIWWRHEMETFSALLDLCVENVPVTGEFPAQRPVTRNFDVFFDLRLNKLWSKQCWGWWFETPSRPLWHHCHDNCLCMFYWTRYLIYSIPCQCVLLGVLGREWTSQYLIIATIDDCKYDLLFMARKSLLCTKMIIIVECVKWRDKSRWQVEISMALCKRNKILAC